MKEKGFTLIELIVVMAVFLFIVGGAIIIFISILQHQKRLLSEQQVLNQTSYVQEYMSKALRMARTDIVGDCLLGHSGYIYLLTRPDTESGLFRGIKFINQSDNDACQEFFLDNIIPGDEDTPLVLKELKNSVDDNDAVPLTSISLKIASVRFGINGADGSLNSCSDTLGKDILDCGASQEDIVQPRVTIFLNVKDKIMQTTVSQRDLNVKQ